MKTVYFLALIIVTQDVRVNTKPFDPNFLLKEIIAEAQHDKYPPALLNVFVPMIASDPCPHDIFCLAEKILLNIDAVGKYGIQEHKWKITGLLKQYNKATHCNMKKMDNYPSHDLKTMLHDVIVHCAQKNIMDHGPRRIGKQH